MAASTSELISSSLVFSCSSSSTKWRTCLKPLLTEPSCNVIFRLFFRRRLEDDRGAIEFDQTAQQEKTRVVGDAGRLLHVVGHDDDGATVLELENQVFDLGGGDWIERRTRLVEQQDFRIHRQR